LARWGITSLSKGFYEFSFSNIEDVRRVRSINSWKLEPGYLKLFTWSRDFNPNLRKINQRKFASSFMAYHKNIGVRKSYLL